METDADNHPALPRTGAVPALSVRCKSWATGIFALPCSRKGDKVVAHRYSSAATWSIQVTGVKNQEARNTIHVFSFLHFYSCSAGEVHRRPAHRLSAMYSPTVVDSHKVRDEHKGVGQHTGKKLQNNKKMAE